MRTVIITRCLERVSGEEFQQATHPATPLHPSLPPTVIDLILRISRQQTNEWHLRAIVKYTDDTQRVCICVCDRE